MDYGFILEVYRETDPGVMESVFSYVSDDPKILHSIIMFNIENWRSSEGFSIEISETDRVYDCYLGDYDL